ncbi:phosphatase PAP2 family protein [Clostridium manihotivorum]|uniref:Phospholipid phosphatase n=1 Tax=Clostridium manihotivorum TaxID=2320868 RepID=A0A410DSW7_9CLOT|nr:phosphatase PAP2 family protein [Clostridium manihotivorum]QAA32131.1 phospholipid phosphatase [Clostridium manihotivorum]
MGLNKRIVPLVLLAAVTTSCFTRTALADAPNAPQPAAYGYYVDSWKNNTTSNMTPSTNPAIGVLSEYLKLWTPGTAWNNGTILNAPILNSNIQKSIDITNNRSEAEAHQAYLDDRRNQSYGIINGLGKYTDAFIAGANAGTSIPYDIPQDATTKKYDDKGNSNGNWAETNSNLGNMVNLVNVLRSSAASTTPAKSYYQYPRPWRWSTDVKVLPTLEPAKSTTPETDGGFPSGHTNAAYLAAIGLAYAFPERFQEMITRASELGYDRIVAGMHSPLDVMGGRMTSTAIAAAALNNPDNQIAKLAAYNDGRKLLAQSNASSVDRFSDYAKNKKNYTDRLTYGFPQIGDKSKAMIVPKGAEVLLETRLPYLDANQRRAVLATTGVQSGFPLLDDAEGWGRLNLFAAADGYGALLDKVNVNMDAAKGGFNALDIWKNDIAGNGSLVKNGTGTLKLIGNNSYSGGTEVDNGTLEMDSANALGSGKVNNNGGTITEAVAGAANIGSEFDQAPNSTLELSIGSKDDLLNIADKADLSGNLKLNFLNNYVPQDGTPIITYKKDGRTGQFTSLVTTGLPSNYKVSLDYNADNISLKLVDTNVVKVNTIAVSGKDGASSITTRGGKLQMLANVGPDNATDKSVTWSVLGADGKHTDLASIDQNGLLTALKDGNVQVVATAKDGSGVNGQTTVAISGQAVISTQPTDNSGNGGSNGNPSTPSNTNTTGSNTNTTTNNSGSNSNTTTNNTGNNSNSNNGGSSSSTINNTVNGSSNSTGSNTVKTSTSSLPKTGAMIDSNLLGLMGSLLVGAGSIGVFRRKRKED